MTEKPIFVGRQAELDRLHTVVEQALTGQGQVAFVAGQAGTGKSVLVRHFVDEALARHSDLIAAFGECNAQTGLGDPYLPFRETLAQLTGDTNTRPDQATSSAENARRVRAALVSTVKVLVDVAPDLVGLMIPFGRLLGELGKALATHLGLLQDLETLMQRKGQVASVGTVDQARIFEQYTNFVKALAAEHPLILVIDDMQWADAASIGLLFYLSRRLSGHRILVIGAYRPDDVALGRNGERHPLEPLLHEFKRYFGDTTIDLDRVTADRGRAFVDELLDQAGYAVGPAFRDALFRQTNGHALFTVEVLRSLQESGALVKDSQGLWVEGPALDWSLLPGRVEGVIEERIDRLDDGERRLLQVASVEGEQFTAEVIATLDELDVRTVVRDLSDELARHHHLVDSVGMRRLPDRRLSVYRFVHSLVQRYLYASLGEAERLYLHEDIAKLLEAWYGDTADEIAVQLAHHFAEAGATLKATGYYLAAGNRARRMSAYFEAQSHFQRGLELVVTLPADTLERAAYELALQAALGAALVPTHGYGNSAVCEAFARARELCSEMGDPPQVIPVLYGLGMYYLVSGQVARAQEEGKHLLELAELVRDHDYTLACHVLLAATSFYLGDMAGARDHCLQVGGLYDPAADADLAYHLGQDASVAALSYLSWALWQQGHPDQAAEHEDAALILARQLGHPFTLGLALSFAATLDFWRGDSATAHGRAEEALALAQREHFPFWEAMATQLLGVALARQGQARAGISLLQQGLAGWERSGTRIGVPMFLLSLAEVHFEAGMTDEALRYVEQSMLEGEETHQTWWQPEQHRLRGRILERRGQLEQAAAHFRQGLSIARGHGALSLELRSALCLIRVVPPAEQEQAYEMLAAICARFEPGIEFADLAQARALLAAVPARP